MANTREHRYSVSVTWTSNLGTDPAFCGDGSCWNPEELLVVSLLACHKLR